MLVMVLPSVVMVVKTASVVTGTEEPAAPPAPPKMVVLPTVLVIVLPSVVMVVRTGAVLMAEPLAPVPVAVAPLPLPLPLPPAPPAAVPVTSPDWVRAWVALRVTEDEAPEAAEIE